jgi:phage terminase large subunit
VTLATRHKLDDLAVGAPSLTLGEDFVASGRQYLVELSRIQWPSPKYRGRYVEFAYDILGIELWSLDPSISDPLSGGQVEICEAVAQHSRVAVASGQKIGKTTVEVVVALCDYCSYDDMRVIMTSTTGHQVDEVFWRELMIRKTRAGKCVECVKADPYDKTIPRPCPHSAFIDGKMGEKARTGLKSGFREIYGLTANEGEALLGISGANMRFIVDEASGVRDAIMRGLDGNRAGDASFLMFGNPTKNEGYFFDAFHEKSAFWRTFNISSEHNPNALSGEKRIPGLATRGYIDERKEEWGEKSPEYTIKIRGRFAVHEAGCIFSIHAIGEAESRWKETEAAGRLFIGVDPAGASGTGDESCFTARRGKKQLELEVARGLNADAHLVRILQMVSRHNVKGEAKPVVVIDREGSVGAELHGTLRDFVERNPQAFELVAVRASDGAVRQPGIYDRMRDELAANLEGWLRDDGAIVTDIKLSKELHALRWQQRAHDGKLKVTPKDQIKKALGRSPDRYDALALACWEPLSLREDEDNPATRAAAGQGDDEGDLDFEAGLDPYGAADFWRGR